MKKSLAILRIVVCLTAAVFLWAGCDDPPKTAAQPQSVRKKIMAQNGSAQNAVKPPVAAVGSGKPVTAQARLPEKPKPAPLPKPAEPSPPTQTAQPAPAPPAQALTPPLAPNSAQAPQLAAAPSAGPAMPATTSAAPAAAVSESQVATLLNIQVPAPYNPKGKIDPFEPLLKDESAAVVAKVRVKTDPNRPKTPLERIDLGQLKLVAIIAASTGNRALVEESSGKGYIIKAGTFIGLNSGKVVDIKNGKVLVEEEFEDVYGKAITQKKEITLPKPPGEL
jgi:type IV pilus assembly protein PilP